MMKNDMGGLDFFSLTAVRQRVFDLEIALRQMTAGYRDLPDFVIVGTQRGGTTSLYRYLMQHPCVAASRKKEIHYFSRFFYKSQRWYRAHFPTAWYKTRMKKDHDCTILTGEASPYYMFHPASAARIAQVIPLAKLIVMLRNPVDRAFSHYLHNLKRADVVEELSFEDAIQAEEKRLAGEVERLTADVYYSGVNYRQYSYLARGLYLEQLKRLKMYFPSKQILIISSEAFFANTTASFANVLKFLGLPDWSPSNFQVYNPSRENNAFQNVALNPETRQRLVEFFRPHNQQLYHYLDQDLGWGD